jgi:hypothetical protein
MKKTALFNCTQPCGNCPYRTDAPLQLWDKSEFKKLLEKEHDYLGTLYYCHKQNGSVCVGWLMKQYEANFPSNILRMTFSKENITQSYFDGLNSPAPLFDNVSAMIKANYPELLKIPVKKEKELLRIVTQFRKGILAKRQPHKMCKAICWPLQGFLQFANYRTELVEGEIIQDGITHEHYWLSYNDIIIDPTASQFKNPDGEIMPDILIGEKPNWYKIIKP